MKWIINNKALGKKTAATVIYSDEFCEYLDGLAKNGKQWHIRKINKFLKLDPNPKSLVYAITRKSVINPHGIPATETIISAEFCHYPVWQELLSEDPNNMYFPKAKIIDRHKKLISIDGKTLDANEALKNIGNYAV